MYAGEEFQSSSNFSPLFCLSQLKMLSESCQSFLILYSISPFCTQFPFFAQKKLHRFGIDWHVHSQSECRNCCLYITKSEISHQGVNSLFKAQPPVIYTFKYINTVLISTSVSHVLSFDNSAITRAGPSPIVVPRCSILWATEIISHFSLTEIPV